MEEWRAQRTHPYSSMRPRESNANVLSSTLLQPVLSACLKVIVKKFRSESPGAFAGTLGAR
jgi:hypothetical protein